MRTEDIPRYAQAVVGFPIHVGMKVIVEEECLGIGRDLKEYTSFKGAEAEVLAIRLLPLPDQLAITLKITIDAAEDLYIEDTFTENDPEPVFPFVVPKTQEEIELERAEAAAREATKAEAKDPNPTPTSPPISKDEEEEWRNYLGRGYH
jgi:hypothetical protein